MEREQQRIIGILINSGVHKHPDGRHLYQLTIQELTKLRVEYVRDITEYRGYSA